MSPRRLLVVSAGEALVHRLTTRFGVHHQIHVVSTPDACVLEFKSVGADVVLLCLPTIGSGRELIQALHGVDARIRIVVAGTDQGIPSDADAFQLNVFEHVDSAANVGPLLAAVGAALGSRSGDAQLQWLKQQDAVSWDSVLGTAPTMKAVVDMLRRVCERTSRGNPPTLLIRGETGTGKGLLAKCVHYNSVRRNSAFVELNCAAIPPSLLEAELFGYERGAFTDARTSKAGLFETAHRGTLFLDEIGTLPINLQAKLLTAIEEKRVRRIGSRQSVQFDVQIMAAAHMNLHQKVKAGEFRDDLYHRLNVVPATIPPLRERGGDKLVLARAFIESACRAHGVPPRRLSEAAEQYVLQYTWPGNVRELKNQIERVILLTDDPLIEPRHFQRPSIPVPSTAASCDVASFALKQGIGLEEVERALIEEALRVQKGNVSRAAKNLKISRQTLIYRMKKHGLRTDAK